MAVENSGILFEKSTMGMTRAIAKIGPNPKPILIQNRTGKYYWDKSE
ncbi:MAG: hypothetical protein Q7J00_06480 [Synergistaceae bacterium]|nr:hypothetical protein [Synergistaceae bacterium]